MVVNRRHFGQRGKAEREGEGSMRITGIIVAVVLGTALLTGGCVTRGNSAIMDPAKVDQIKVDVTTKAEVQQMFGRPTTTTGYHSSASGVGSNRGDQWIYSYGKGSAKWWVYVPILSYVMMWFADGAEGEGAYLNISFTPEGIVKQVDRSQTSLNN